MLWETIIGQLALRRQITLAVAESCTGGLVGHRLTNVPGSSAYFLGGVIAYAEAIKIALLGVQPETLRQFGAVSEPTAREMARGVRQKLGATLGLAITGIAGPGGATPGKPVGLTWIALAAPDYAQAERYVWTGDREANKAGSAEAALKMLGEFLQKEA